MDNADAARVATALSEVARNIVEHAGEGQVILQDAESWAAGACRSLRRTTDPVSPMSSARHSWALRSKEFSVGLPGAKWMMDDFDIVSIVGIGTTVTMTKWNQPMNSAPAIAPVGARPQSAHAPSMHLPVTYQSVLRTTLPSPTKPRSSKPTTLAGLR